MTVRWMGPAWLRSLADRVGVDIFHRAVKVSLDGPRFDDAHIDTVQRLEHLEEVRLYKTDISDAGVARLEQALPRAKIEVTRGSDSPSPAHATHLLFGGRLE